MTSLELAKKAAAFLDNKKAERVHVIEIENISSLRITSSSPRATTTPMCGPWPTSWRRN